MFQSLSSLSNLLLYGHVALDISGSVALLILLPIEESVGRPVNWIFYSKLFSQRGL